MAGFLADAGQAGDVAGSCARAGISLLDYHRERARDLRFGLECQDLDQLVRLAVVSGLEAQAAAGSLGAAKLLARGLGDLMRGIDPDLPAREPATPSWEDCPACEKLRQENALLKWWETRPRDRFSFREPDSTQVTGGHVAVHLGR